MTDRLCLCGCGRRVKTYRNRWATPQCVPREIRAEACRKGRRTWAYRRRALTFRAAYERHFNGQRVVTREAILTFGAELYEKGYAAGQHRRLYASRPLFLAEEATA
jgi:hypothetical protein